MENPVLQRRANNNVFGLRNRFRRGWRITKLGIHVVKADPELIIYVLF